MPAPPSIFDINRRALKLFDPRTAACIESTAATAQNVIRAEESAHPWPQIDANDTVVLLGIGDGSKIFDLLKIKGIRILVLECDIPACLAVLHEADFSEALAQGRLRLLLVPSMSPIASEISQRECIAQVVHHLHRAASKTHFVATSTTGNHQAFFDAVRQGAQECVAAIAELGRQPASAIVYDVTVVSPCCAIFDNLATCFHQLGLKTQLLRVPDRHGVWSAAERRAALLSLAQTPSRLVITRNRVLFETDRPTDLIEPEALIPGKVGMWWWDVPNVASQIDLRFPRGNARAFAFARKLLPLLPQGAEWLPPGARTPFEDAGALPEMACDIGVSFVGQSRLQELHQHLRHLQSSLADLGGAAPAFAHDLERASGYVGLHQVLTAHYHDIKDEIEKRSIAFPSHAYYLRYLLEMALTGSFRIAAIERLLAEGIEIALFGDEEWLKLPCVTQAHFKGLIDPADLPSLYRRSRINLNLNFMQVSSTVNPKVLDIAAAGGVALTDSRPELSLLYPDPAARPFVFYSLEDLPERVAALAQADLSHHRKAVREQTCNHHTLRLRAQWIARYFGLK